MRPRACLQGRERASELGAASLCAPLRAAKERGKERERGTRAFLQAERRARATSLLLSSRAEREDGERVG